MVYILSSVNGSNCKCFCLIVFIFLAIYNSTAQANKPADVTERDMQTLPVYCPDTMGFKYGSPQWNHELGMQTNGAPRAIHWVKIMGKDFWHVHHHCWALINVNRSERAGVPEMEKKAMREAALGNFWYVVNNASSDFVLLPEIYTWIGRMEIKLRRPQKANEAFARAREIKVDYWPAYSHWAEYLLGVGKKSEALKVVITGLEKAPTSKVLIELFRVLGGKPSDIPMQVQESSGGAPKDRIELIDAPRPAPEPMTEAE